jgi:hypothetical protein
MAGGGVVKPQVTLIIILLMVVLCIAHRVLVPVASAELVTMQQAIGG